MHNPNDHYSMLKDLIPFYYDWYWGEEIVIEKFFLLIDDSLHHLLIDDASNKLLIQGS